MTYESEAKDKRGGRSRSTTKNFSGLRIFFLLKTEKKDDEKAFRLKTRTSNVPHARSRLSVSLSVPRAFHVASTRNSFLPYPLPLSVLDLPKNHQRWLMDNFKIFFIEKEHWKELKKFFLPQSARKTLWPEKMKSRIQAGFTKKNLPFQIP